MASMNYGVSRNGTRGIGYDSYEESYSEKEDKPNTLHSYFVSVGFVQKEKPSSVPRAKPIAKPFRFNSCKYDYSAAKPKVGKNSGNTNKKGPKKLWVQMMKIIYVAYILSSKVKTPVMVPGLWMLATHDRKKAYVSNPEGILGFRGDKKGKIIGS